MRRNEPWIADKTQTVVRSAMTYLSNSKIEEAASTLERAVAYLKANVPDVQATPEEAREAVRYDHHGEWRVALRDAVRQPWYGNTDAGIEGLERVRTAMKAYLEDGKLQREQVKHTASLPVSPSRSTGGRS